MKMEAVSDSTQTEQNCTTHNIIFPQLLYENGTLYIIQQQQQHEKKEQKRKKNEKKLLKD
jgi:hypothetical protein